MAKLYTNENFPRAVSARLRELGHDVLTVQEAGNAGQAISDEEVLAFARAHSRIVVTLNRRDFVRLHMSSADHPGIIVCTQDSDYQGQAERIDAGLKAIGVPTGQLIRVNRPQW